MQNRETLSTQVDNSSFRRLRTPTGQKWRFTKIREFRRPSVILADPRTNANNYFTTADFSVNALGDPGTSKRRFFHGPGSENYDIAAAKRLSLADSKSLLFRVEAFNVFNHTQFYGTGSVDGNIGSSTFGNAVSAALPRILQGAIKFNF
jgi:hypothetical protein